MTNTTTAEAESQKQPATQNAQTETFVAGSASADNNVPLVFSCLMLGMLMSSLGQMIFSTALPTLVGDLGGVNKMSWVITIFLLTMTIGMPVYGKLGDQMGRKSLYMVAIVLFLIGSTIGALAQNMEMMILARGVQGLGAGGLMIGAQAIIADVVSARDRGRYMGIMGGVFGLSSVLGPLLGGFFTDGPGWRWALWFNLPLGIITLVMVAFNLKLPKRGSGANLDVPGTILMAGTTSCLILFLTWGGRDHPWDSPIIIGLIAATIILGAAFVLVERRVSEPLIPMGLFRVRNFSLTTLAGIIAGVVMFGTLAYLPTYIQMVHGMSPTKAGLMMIPMMAGMILTSVTVGQYVSRTGRYKWFPVVGLLVTATATFLMGGFTANDSLVHLGLVLALMGMGLGLTMQLLVLIVQNAFPVRIVGTATATNNFFRQIGGAAGSAIIGSVFIHRVGDLLSQRMPAALQEMAAKAGPDAVKPYAEQFAHGGASELTPSIVDTLPPELAHVIITSYNDGLTPALMALTPAAIVAALILAFVRQDRLKETVE